MKLSGDTSAVASKTQKPNVDKWSAKDNAAKAKGVGMRKKEWVGDAVLAGFRIDENVLWAPGKNTSH